MSFVKIVRLSGMAALITTLAACGGGGSNPFGGDSGLLRRGNAPDNRSITERQVAENTRQSTILDLFTNADDPKVTVEVNKYLWNASLDVLNFLPIQSVDPFSGVITTGFGTPPGGGRAYRATVLVQDPALEARSLKVALATRGGPVSAETQRAVEDAILTRARQLRLRDADL
ncbi:DUF3576 domain-containing protein [Actibacterium sp. 188UL27-1]|uniref:DUF3576 domain-containing protein n=1 Tax=Actibacterium sp. 188UL27-1 TaxID=2786961 RepID=UPI00195C7AF7|nr:DUF3576 domain-containing protein [Actibacterium sp. 188UL27-1]MBM7067159.1 DUF3576 domain-containing protein [Actibacterium sp. 188UL27-1]